MKLYTELYTSLKWCIVSTLPEYVVVDTTEHKCLQSQFSVLYNEAMQLKTQLEENRYMIN